MWLSDRLPQHPYLDGTTHLSFNLRIKEVIWTGKNISGDQNTQQIKHELLEELLKSMLTT